MLSAFINTIVLAHMVTPIHLLRPIGLRAELSSCKWNCMVPKSQNYLLSGCLRKWLQPPGLCWSDFPSNHISPSTQPWESELTQVSNLDYLFKRIWESWLKEDWSVQVQFVTQIMWDGPRAPWDSQAAWVAEVRSLSQSCICASPCSREYSKDERQWKII